MLAETRVCGCNLILSCLQESNLSEEHSDQLGLWSDPLCCLPGNEKNKNKKNELIFGRCLALNFEKKDHKSLSLRLTCPVTSALFSRGGCEKSDGS